MNIHLGCKPLGYCRPIRRERLRQSLLSPCLRVFLPQRLADAFMALRTASFWAGLTFRRLRLRARMVLVWRSWAKTSEIFFFPRPPSAPTAFCRSLASCSSNSHCSANSGSVASCSAKIMAFWLVSWRRVHSCKLQGQRVCRPYTPIEVVRLGETLRPMSEAVPKAEQAKSPGRPSKKKKGGANCTSLTRRRRSTSTARGR